MLIIEKESTMTLDEKKRFIINVAFVVTVYAILYFIFVYAIHWFMPFIIGFLIALALRPITKFINHFIKSTGRGVTIFVLAAFYVVIALVLWILISFLVSQITDLVKIMPSLYFNKIEPLLKEFNDWIIINLKNISPDAADHISQITTSAIVYISSTIKNISIFFVELVTKMISNFPLYLISVIFTIVLSVFISVEYDDLTAFVKRQLPEKFNSSFSEARKFLSETICKVIKSYIIIMLITFTELLIGLSILNINSAFPIAAIIAVLDILPVLGTGGVLIPWALIAMVLKNFSLAVGLLALYLIITVVRNIIEPKIVGQQIGLNPIITITVMYAGLRLFGFFGLIAAPIVAILVKNLNDTGKIHLFK